MRTFDLAPLYRSTVGFDRLFSMLDGFEAAPGYPPYNIERTGENDYRITVAVAGFGENELSLEAKENTLTIKGEKQVKQDNSGEVLYQGIAGRAFERQFQLADYVQVKGASLENGLLHVDLVREIPEAKKPRQIAINGQSQAQPKVVDQKAAYRQALKPQRFLRRDKRPGKPPGRFYFCDFILFLRHADRICRQCGTPSAGFSDGDFDSGAGLVSTAGAGDAGLLVISFAVSLTASGVAGVDGAAAVAVTLAGVAGLGFGTGAGFGAATAAARFTGFSAAGAARCGKRSGGGGNKPSRRGSGALIARGSDGGGRSPPRGGYAVAALGPDGSG